MMRCSDQSVFCTRFRRTSPIVRIIPRIVRTSSAVQPGLVSTLRIVSRVASARSGGQK